MTDKIVRHGVTSGKRPRTTGLTLEPAPARCNDPETSSRPATSPAAPARTTPKGRWLAGYDKED